MNDRNHKRRCRQAILALLLPAFAAAQPTGQVIEGTPGDCHPVFAANQDSLELYREPTPDGRRFSLDYGEGWALPYQREDTLIRVDRPGLFSSFDRLPLASCQKEPRGGPSLKIGEPVQLLFNWDTHHAQVEVRGVQCRVDLQGANLHHVRRPRARLWLHVLYGDGSPAGWLMQDGNQARVARWECPAR